jgi:hypothetical protein
MAKNSKLPKLSKNCFEPVGKGGWPPISTYISEGPPISTWRMCGASHNPKNIEPIIKKKYRRTC